jgi:hypothetical protein
MQKAMAALAALWIAALAPQAQDRGLAVIAREVTGSATFQIGKQYAVIIGIDKYQEWPSLKGSVAEAKQVRNVLAERYFIDEFIELYDQAATASAIRRLFAEDLPNRLGLGDSLLIFFAGHGYLDSSKTGFWIASDGSRDVYDQKGWIPNAQLRNFIAQLKAQRIFVVADACFSGDFLNVSRGALPTVDSAYFKRALQLTARQILTSGASETVPDESEFGRQLVNLLARNTEPLLDPTAMYDRIRRGVSQTEPLLGTIPGHEQGASFVLFLRPASGGSAQAEAAPPAPAQTKGLLKIARPPAQQGSCEVSARAAGTEGAQATILQGEASLDPGEWIVEARLRGDLEPTFSAEVRIEGGKAQTLEIPTLQYSRRWQRKTLQDESDSLSARLASATAARKTKKAFGWVGLGLGAAGLGAAAYSFIDGKAAHDSYSSAVLTQDATDAWARATRDSEILVASASVAALALTAASILFFASPVPALERRLEEVRAKIELLDK